MTSEALVREAYARLDRSDVDGLMDMLASDARFFVPGGTRISGDHLRDAVPGVLRTAEEIAGGTLKRELLDFLTSESSVAVVLHEYVTRDGAQIAYHAIHVWDVKDGKFAYWWVYPHEYDQFERAWS